MASLLAVRICKTLNSALLQVSLLHIPPQNSPEALTRIEIGTCPDHFVSLIEHTTASNSSGGSFLNDSDMHASQSLFSLMQSTAPAASPDRSSRHSAHNLSSILDALIRPSPFLPLRMVSVRPVPLKAAQREITGVRGLREVVRSSCSNPRHEQVHAEPDDFDHRGDIGEHRACAIFMELTVYE